VVGIAGLQLRIDPAINQIILFGCCYQHLLLSVQIAI